MTRARLVAIAAVGFGIAIALWWILQPNAEQRVLRQLAAIRDEFNGGTSGALIASFAADFNDQTTDTNRDELRAVFFHYFQTVGRDQDKLPLCQVEFVNDLPQSVEFKEAQSGATISKTAHVSCLLRFTERAAPDAPAKEVWQVRVDGQFAEYDGDWLLKETRWETLSGRMPLGH